MFKNFSHILFLLIKIYCKRGLCDPLIKECIISDLQPYHLNRCLSNSATVPPNFIRKMRQFFPILFGKCGSSPKFYSEQCGSSPKFDSEKCGSSPTFFRKNSAVPLNFIRINATVPPNFIRKNAAIPPNFIRKNSAVPPK